MMELRTIMALGESSYAITLPIPWINSNNLKKGDKVSVFTQHDGSLAIHSSIMEEEVKRTTLFVKPDENKESIIRRIIAAYLDGYSLIELKSGSIFTSDQQQLIRQTVGTLYMMIIESEANRLVLETLIDESKASVKSTIERMHVITYSMCKDTIKAFKEWDLRLAKSVATLENDVDQLLFLILRLLRSAVMNPSLASQLEILTLDCLDHQALVRSIENIADLVTEIARSLVYLIENNKRIPDKVVSILMEAAEIAFNSFDVAVLCYLSKNIEPTNEIIDDQVRIEDLYKEITPLPDLGEPYSAGVLSHLINIRENITKIGDRAADIAELTIDRSYKSVT
jgi:phosphate uptake regulator